MHVRVHILAHTRIYIYKCVTSSGLYFGPRIMLTTQKMLHGINKLMKWGKGREGQSGHKGFTPRRLGSQYAVAAS